MTGSSIFNFDEKTTALIDKLRIHDHISRSTVIRRALALYDVAIEADKNGEEVIIRGESKETRIIVSCSKTYDTKSRPVKYMF